MNNLAGEVGNRSWVVSLGADMETQPPLDPLYHYSNEMNSVINGIEDEEIDVTNSARRMHRVRKKRGPNRPRWAPNGTLERLKFNAKGQPVAPPRTVGRFSRFLGMLALESSLFPIDNLDWRNFYKNSNMDAAWERIKVRVLELRINNGITKC